MLHAHRPHMPPASSKCIAVHMPLLPSQPNTLLPSFNYYSHQNSLYYISLVNIYMLSLDEFIFIPLPKCNLLRTEIAYDSLPLSLPTHPLPRILKFIFQLPTKTMGQSPLKLPTVNIFWTNLQFSIPIIVPIEESPSIPRLIPRFLNPNPIHGSFSELPNVLGIPLYIHTLPIEVPINNIPLISEVFGFEHSLPPLSPLIDPLKEYPPLIMFLALPLLQCLDEPPEVHEVLTDQYPLTLRHTIAKLSEVRCTLPLQFAVSRWLVAGVEGALEDEVGMNLNGSALRYAPLMLLLETVDLLWNCRAFSEVQSCRRGVLRRRHVRLTRLTLPHLLLPLQLFIQNISPFRNISLSTTIPLLHSTTHSQGITLILYSSTDYS